MKQFLSVKEAAEQLGLSTDTIRDMIADMRGHIPERYSRTDFFEGRRVAVRFAALQDWAEIQSYITLGLTPPPYNPLAREMELGIIPAYARPTQPAQAVDADAIADKVLEKLLLRLMGRAAS